MKIRFLIAAYALITLSAAMASGRESGGMSGRLSLASRAQVAPDHKFTGEVLKYNIFLDSSEAVLGPFYVWLPPEPNARPQQFTHSVSSLASVLERVMNTPSEELNLIAEQQVALNIFGEFCRRSDAFVMTARALKEYLAQAERVLGESGCESLKAMLIEPNFESVRDEWQMEIDLITEDGRIERHALSGIHRPFEMRSYSVRLMPNSELTKKVGYIPGAGDQ